MKRVKIISIFLTLFLLTSLFSGCKTRVIEGTESTYYEVIEVSNETVNEASNATSITVDDSSNATSKPLSEGTNNNSSKTKSKNTSDTNSTTSKTTSTPSVKPVEETKELSGRLELQIFTGGYSSEMWENVIASFEKANPKLDVVAHLDPNVNKQMQTRWIKGTPPDFVFLEGSGIPKNTWIAEGMLMDLTSFYNTATVYGTNQKIKDKLTPGVTPLYSGKVRELPIILTAYGMWYDQNYFNELGVTAPKNYTELMSFGNAVKAKNGMPLIYTGVYSNYLVWGFLMPAIAAHGQTYFNEVCNENVKPETFQDKRFKAALTKLKEFVDAGYVVPESLSLNHIISQQQWLSHKAALIPCGLWLENEMKNSIPKGFDMKFLPTPTYDANQKPTVVAMPVTMGVAEKAKNKDAALEFIRYLYQDSSLKTFAEKSGAIVPCELDLTGAKITPVTKELYKMLNSNDVSFVTKSTGWTGPVDSKLNDVVNQIVKKTMTVDQAVDALVAATKIQSN